jgi:hypothetical protein
MIQYLKDCFTAEGAIGLLLFACVAGLLYIGARLLDEGLGEAIPRQGIVIGREHSPAFTIYTKVGEVMTPIEIPDAYSLTVDTDEGIANVPCSLYDYNNAHNGAPLRFNDRVGYITGIRYKK